MGAGLWERACTLLAYLRSTNVNVLRSEEEVQVGDDVPAIC